MNPESASLAAESPADGVMPTVLVVSCGGTISALRAGGASGATPSMGAVDLVADLPELRSLARVRTRTFATVPSVDMSLPDVQRLHAALTAAADADPELAGIVVTHGTDTMEEVALALDLMWDRRVPLVLTGAMRNSSLPGSDGPANLLAAVATAASPAARDVGVLVVFNDEIHAAALVRKSHTSNVATFRSPAFGPIGYIAEKRPRIVLRPFRSTVLPPLMEEPPPIALLTVGLGDDGRLLSAVHRSGFGGLVLEAPGGGHLPAVMAESPALRDLLTEMPVVLASRTGAGEVLTSTYAGFAGSESALLGMGLIPAGSLAGPQARVLLALALASGAATDAVRLFFTRFAADRTADQA